MAQKASPAKSTETLLFEEAVAKTYEDLSRAARTSRIPRWVQKCPPPGCLTDVAQSSNDESKKVSASSTSAPLLGGEKQVGTSRIPIPRRFVERFRGKVKTGTKLPPNNLTRKWTSLVSRLGAKSQPRLTKQVSESGSSPDNVFGHEVKLKPKVVKKVHFAFGQFERTISRRLRTREWAPKCLVHATCRELGREKGFHTCMISEEDGAKPPNFAVWHEDQLKMGHDYFSEYGDILGDTFVTDVDGAILEGSRGRPLRDLKAINSL